MKLDEIEQAIAELEAKRQQLHDDLAALRSEQVALTKLQAKAANRPLNNGDIVKVVLPEDWFYGLTAQVENVTEYDVAAEAGVTHCSLVFKNVSFTIKAANLRDGAYEKVLI